MKSLVNNMPIIKYIKQVVGEYGGIYSKGVYTDTYNWLLGGEAFPPHYTLKTTLTFKRSHLNAVVYLDLYGDDEEDKPEPFKGSYELNIYPETYDDFKSILRYVTKELYKGALEYYRPFVRKESPLL